MTSTSLGITINAIFWFLIAITIQVSNVIIEKKSAQSVDTTLIIKDVNKQSIITYPKSDHYEYGKDVDNEMLGIKKDLF